MPTYFDLLRIHTYRCHPRQGALQIKLVILLKWKPDQSYYTKGYFFFVPIHCIIEKKTHGNCLWPSFTYFSLVQDKFL